MRIFNFAQLTALCLLTGAAIAFAGTSVHVELNLKKAQADSLQEKADSLEEAAETLQDRLDDVEDDKEEHEDLEDEIEDLQERISDLKEQISDANEDLKDDVADVAERKQEALEDIAESRKDALDDINEEAQERRRSGSFILDFEYSHLDTDPLEDLVRSDRSLKAARGKIDFSGNRMLMFGLMGYYNLENDVRVGNGVYAGYRSFTSSTLYDTLSSGRIDSTIVSLNVIPAYIGFICEKAFVYEPVNFFAGLMLGGNMSIVIKKEQDAEEASLFVGEEESDDNSEVYSVAIAPAFAFDFHGGMAIRLAPKLHLGIDGILRCAYAYQGFGAGFGDFLSVNPGIRMRLTFGSAG